MPTKKITKKVQVVVQSDPVLGTAKVSFEVTGLVTVDVPVTPNKYNNPKEYIEEARQKAMDLVWKLSEQLDDWDDYLVLDTDYYIKYTAKKS